MLDFVLHTRGPTFLAVYAAFCVVVIWVMNRIARKGFERAPTLDLRAGGRASPTAVTGSGARFSPRDTYEVAYLVDGARGVIGAAVTKLLASDAVQIAGHRFAASARDVGEDAPAVEKAIHRTVIGLEVRDVLRSQALLSLVEERCSALRQKLLAFGLIVENDGARRFGYWALSLAFTLGLGLAKVTSALARGHHNVGFLVVGMVIAFIVTTVVFARSGRLTYAGRRLVADIKAETGRLRASLSRRDGPNPEDWALVAGTLGVNALHGGPHAQMAQTIIPVPVPTTGYSSCSSTSTSSSCSSSSSSCSSSSDSGGGSSCSSGGSGCGGCGGGGGGD